jgi:L-aspartate oxidase
MPRPLLSEALRGHGAVVRDVNGRRFVDELLPRDQVARAITARTLELGVEHCWLDATGLERFAERFPTIAASLAAVGLDPARDWLPIAPAAHYLSGGVLTDLDGSSALPGLWAAGEVACTGVHGANRLASNSLLEGMVFGARVVDAIVAGRSGPQASGAMRGLLGGGGVAGRSLPLPRAPEANMTGDPVKLRAELQQSMTAGAGVLRSAASLEGTAAVLARLARATGTGPDWVALANLVTVGRALVTSALAREESRGNHTRTDHPTTREELRCRLVLT